MEVAPLSPAALDRLPRHALGVSRARRRPSLAASGRLPRRIQGSYPAGLLRRYAWYAWCAGAGVHPLGAPRHHIDRWIAELTELPSRRPASLLHLPGSPE